MVVRLDDSQPVYSLPSLEIPDEEEDAPAPGLSLVRQLGSASRTKYNQQQLKRVVGALQLPEIIFGAAALSSIYNEDSHLSGFTPVRTVRLALRYGINAFDTSAYYQQSEIVLGTALKALETDFPRSSYKLMTKCGRYGSTRADFDYSPTTIRASVQRSLKRLNTTYLDAVYLHDVEFIATQVGARVAGDPTLALNEKKAEYGLVEGEEGKVWGEGDQKILDALAELRKMQDEGIVKAVGITGYPLPTLLRLALLALHTPPYKPLDVLLSYSHLMLQNTAFAEFAPHFRDRAKISQLLTASPLNMGLLTPKPPAWHPASQELRDAAKQASSTCAQWDGGLPNVAVGFSFRKANELSVPTVVGLSNPREVHENVRVWREICEGKEEKELERLAQEQEVLKVFDNLKGWSWASPPSKLL
ncbi:Aldo/keto reductase [Laetiporus sulphureus 93-53]|uniref:Aldo/keto reductase n=1 Tax=Laetiporus sulphureus 93-53 TaxID=1314785 RepID=A0A165II78_9APHY|nr:Aldo/keto reductase [Laetiporus sulphureus 93-53]KZT13110.1 Aldo/keto reductase [Laetiporus sulphureus 93-53]